MALRYRKTYTLFPGVRLNIAKTGISASFGVPGATVNINRDGVMGTVGMPGTGLSYRTRRTGFGHDGHTSKSTRAVASQSQREHPDFRHNTPRTASTYIPPENMTEITSAPVESLTSASLVPLQALIIKARTQLAQVRSDLRAAVDEKETQTKKLERKRRSIFRWFYRRSIVTLEESLSVIIAEIERLREWEDSTRIEVKFDAGEAVEQAYKSLTHAFEIMTQAEGKWDLMASRATNQVVERTSASQNVDTVPVIFEFVENDLLQFPGRAMRFENANGADILLYPGMALVPSSKRNFALVDIRDLSLSVEMIRFHERKQIPQDTEVVGKTWARTNNDGSPDRRFKNNHEIPICLYALISFRSSTGICEDYLVSSPRSATEFVEAMVAYKRALDEAPDVIEPEGEG